jgi:hypothetical protein
MNGKTHKKTSSFKEKFQALDLGQVHKNYGAVAEGATQWLPQLQHLFTPPLPTQFPLLLTLQNTILLLLQILLLMKMGAYARNM